MTMAPSYAILPTLIIGSAATKRHPRERNRMQIRLYATLRPIVGRATVELNATAGDTVRMMLDELVTRWPDLKPKLFIKDGELHPSIHVFLNGRDIRYLGGLEMAIPDETEICIFPPVGGGHP